MEYNYSDLDIKGIINNGNTCYINSIIQSLLKSEDILYFILYKQYIINGKYKTNEDDTVIEELNTLCTQFKYMLDNNINGQLNISRFLIRLNKKLNINVFEQNDVHEFLQYLIEQINNEIGCQLNININIENPNNLSKTDELTIKAIQSWETTFQKCYSQLHKILFSQYISQVKCTNCNNKTYQFEATLCLEIEISGDTLGSCLDNYTKSEKIDEFNCDNCKQNANALKKMILWKHAQNLIIILKRFGIDKKNNEYIDIPLDLDIAAYCINSRSKSTEYSLYSIINHIGNVDSGHYYTYTKSNKNDKWYECNDIFIQNKEISDLSTENAYCLFYSRK